MQDDDISAGELEKLKRQQEFKNLQLTEEKMRRELVDLRRPYLLRNPQLLTALITTIGAVVGVSILISDNYFKAREQLNRLTEEKTARVAAEAERIQKEAAQKIAAAQALTEKAKQRTIAAEKDIAESDKRRLEAERSAKYQEKLAAHALSDAKRAQNEADKEQRKVFANLGFRSR